MIFMLNLIAGTPIAIEAQAVINLTRLKFFDKFLFGVRRMKKHLLALALIAATGAAQAGNAIIDSFEIGRASCRERV